MSIRELFQIRILHGYILQILLAEMLYLGAAPDRGKHPRLRAVVGLLVFAALAVSIPNMILYYYGSGLISLSVFLLSLLLWYFCKEVSFHKVLFCCISAQLTQNLSYNIECVFSGPVRERFGYVGWFVLSVGVMASVYAACSRIYTRRFRHAREEVDRRIFFFALASSFYTFTIQYMFKVYGIDAYWITKMPMILCNLFGLGVLWEWLAIEGKDQENVLLQTLIERERQQFELINKNNEVINMKAHDLKHFVSQMSSRNMADPGELQEIEAALLINERKFDTGCSTLDILLGDKQAVCEGNNINLSVVTDGTPLDFLSTGDLVALFGNALDNAIECESGVQPEELRYIALHISRHNNLVSIRLENYFSGSLNLVGGLPATTKKDSDLHGFGLKSIRYIAQKYGGTVSISQENSVFVLSILLLMQQSET